MTTRRIIPTPAEMASDEAGTLPRRVKWASQIVWATPIMIVINTINPWLWGMSPHLSFTTNLAIALGIGFVTFFAAALVVRRWRPISPRQISELEHLTTERNSRARLANRIEAGMTFVDAAAEIDRLSSSKTAKNRDEALSRLRSGR
jgi:hypothetical protein